MCDHLIIGDTIGRHGHVAPHMTAIEHVTASFERIWIYKRRLTLHVSVGGDEVLRRQRLFIISHDISWHHAWPSGRQVGRSQVIGLKSSKEAIELFVFRQVEERLALWCRWRSTRPVIGGKGHPFDTLIVYEKQELVTTPGSKSAAEKDLCLQPKGRPVESWP